MLEFVVGVIYWWLPIVGVIGRQLRTCEETCCDAAVVARVPEARREYARLLLDVIDFANSPRGQAAPQATAMSAADDLEQRLRAILDPTRGTARTQLAGAFAVGLACAVLPCQVQFGFDVRPAPAGTSAGQAPAAGTTRLPGGDGEGGPLKGFGCCPS
jgi:beta-lactamase regulating signal transducer with metallopeptidase domain